MGGPTAFMFAFGFGLAVMLIISAQPVGKGRTPLRERLDSLTSNAGISRRRRAEMASRVDPLIGASPALNRLVHPPLLWLGDSLDRLLNRHPDEESRVERWLLIVDPNRSPAAFRAQQLAFFIGGTALVSFLSTFGVPIFSALPPPLWLAGGFAVALLPWMQLRTKVQERQKLAEAELPGFIEMLVLGNSAGQSPELAMADSHRRLTGPLGDAIGDIVANAVTGERTYIAGLREASRREGIETLELIAVAWDLSRRGTPLGPSLDQMASDISQRENLRLVEAAGRAQLQMLGPTMLLIFPAFLIVLMYPIVTTLLTGLSNL